MCCNCRDLLQCSLLLAKASTRLSQRSTCSRTNNYSTTTGQQSASSLWILHIMTMANQHKRLHLESTRCMDGLGRRC